MLLIRALFGELSWTPPGWLQRIGTKRFVLGMLSLIVVVAAIAGVRNYLASLPKPPMVYARVVSPTLSPVVDDEIVPQPLYVDFRVEADPRVPVETVDSVARIDLQGEIVEQGISLDPAMAGTWRWASETRLMFEPQEDWPAGQEYTVRYEDSIFAPGLEFSGFDASFTAPAFNVTLEEFIFYQDPVEQSERRVVATLSFTHPVNEQSLANSLSLSMRESGTPVTSSADELQRSVEYDALRRTAYIHSAPIRIPDRENYATLEIDKSITPESGPSRIREEIFSSVRIPDVGSYFKPSMVNAIITSGAEDEPLQSLVLEFTDQVRANSLVKKLKVWVLPTDVVINGGHHTDKYWSSPREVTREVLAQAQEYAFDLNPTERAASQYHSATIDVPEAGWLYLQIDEGLESEGGFVLSRMYDHVISVPRYPREVSIAQSGAVLPVTSDHKLTFVSRGVAALKVEVGRLIDSEVNHLASQTRGDIRQPYFNNYNFNEDNLATRETRFIDLRTAHPKEAVYSSLDLSEFLPGGGYYFINVQGWDRVNDRPDGGSDRRLVLITDLGLLVKSNSDSSRDVFVHSIVTGNPISGAQVALLGKNGVPIQERVTSADGHASFSSTSEFSREKTPTVYVVRSGDDSVFMPFERGDRRLQYSRFDIGGEYVRDYTEADKLKAQVFTDRGIYRPGDMVNLAAIVKSRDWQALGDLPLQLQIRDPRNQLLLDKHLRLPDSGFFDEQLETELSSFTGDYHATLFLIDQHQRHRSIGSTSFRVEEFQPDRLRIRSSIEGGQQQGWVKPGDLHADVTLQNLFGTPAQARRVTGELQLRPASVHIKQYADYTFVDPLRDEHAALQAVTIPLQEASTDEDGRARLPLDVGQYDKGIYLLTLDTQGYEEGGGRSVRSRTSAMMSPLDTLVGYKTGSDLSFIDKASEHSVEFIAVNSDAAATRLDNLTMTLVSERYVSSLVRRPNGTYAYQSLLQEQPVRSEEFAIASTGTQYSLPTDEAGTFSLKVMDASGLVVGKVRYTVAGARNVAGNLERNAELELKVSGKSFDPGGEIEMEITAPYTGTGLITIERDRVYAYRWFTTDTMTSVQSIRVPEGIEGNAYVNVAFVRDIDSPEIFVSPLSYAVEPFAVNRGARTIEIDLDVPELVRPGEQFEIGYTASSDSKVVVYAVDEGVLQVARYDMPRPLDFFLPKMALQVGTYQMVDLILPEFEAYLRAAAPGGGEGAMLAGKNLNPFQRKTEPPVVFWSGIIDAGPEANTVSFDVPDYFNGEVRVMAVAVNSAAVGRKQTKATVRGPFVVTPNLLTAAAPGDEFAVNVGVANNLEGSGPDASIQLLTTASPHLEIIEGADQALSIAENSEGRAKLRVRTLSKLGGATLSFKASSGDEQATRNATVSVRPSVAYVATIESGSSSDDPIALEVSRTLLDEFASQTVSASSSPLILADGMLEFLEVFPHYCAEQTVSKMFPQLGFLNSPDADVDKASIQKAFDQVISRLRSRQMPEGGFRFWASSREPHGFASVYLTHFLSDAGELDLPVPPDMLRAAVDFLGNTAGQPVNTLAENRLRAYAIYVLTRNGQVTTNYLTNLHEYLEREHKDTWRKDLVAAYMAASYELLKQSQLGIGLIRGYELGTGLEMASDFDTRLGRDAQYIYLVAKHFPDRLGTIGGKGIESLVGPVLRNRYNTLSAAYTILALNAWTDVMRAKDLTLSISSASGEELTRASSIVRAEFDRHIRELAIGGSAGNDIFYVLAQTGFDATPPDNAVANGLEVQRDYLDGEGNAVTSAQIGDELTVRLRVRSTARSRTNVAVVDLLPGGFEVLTDTVQNNFRGWFSDHIDVREDRVIIYGSFGDRITEYEYKVKLTSAGSFVVPSVFAGSMYDRTIEARSKPGHFEVSAM